MLVLVVYTVVAVTAPLTVGPAGLAVAAAHTLDAPRKLRPIAALGLVGCIAPAFTLPPVTVAGVGVLAAGALGRLLLSRRGHRDRPPPPI